MYFAGQLDAARNRKLLTLGADPNLVREDSAEARFQRNQSVMQVLLMTGVLGDEEETFKLLIAFVADVNWNSGT